MADIKKKETKVLSLEQKPGNLSAQEKKIQRLQQQIDQGLYKVSAEDIAKAYLQKQSVESSE